MWEQQEMESLLKPSRTDPVMNSTLQRYTVYHRHNKLRQHKPIQENRSAVSVTKIGVITWQYMRQLKRDRIWTCRITNCRTHSVPAPVQHQTLLSPRCRERQGWNHLGRNRVAKLIKIVLLSTGSYCSGQSASHPSGPNTWFNVFEAKLQSSSNGSEKLSEVMWCVVMWSAWRDLCEVILFWSEVKWVTVKFLGTNVPCTLVWPYTECTWLYCHYFNWCVSYTVFFLTCNVWVFW
jgi:hypothetical protein